MLQKCGGLYWLKNGVPGLLSPGRRRNFLADVPTRDAKQQPLTLTNMVGGWRQ